MDSRYLMHTVIHSWMTQNTEMSLFKFHHEDGDKVILQITIFVGAANLHQQQLDNKIYQQD